VGSWWRCNITRRGVGGLGTAQEEVLAVLEHHEKSCWWFGTCWLWNITGSEHHKKKCWYLWNITRREVGGFETSQEEVLVPLEHHTKSCKKKCLQTLEHHSFGASPEEAVVVLKHFLLTLVSPPQNTVVHATRARPP